VLFSQHIQRRLQNFGKLVRYCIGPLSSRDLVRSHLIDYSRKAGEFSRNKILELFYFNYSRNLDYTFTVKE
jgi:hypothetical protein